MPDKPELSIEEIRKLAETYRPNPQVIADQIAQEAKLRRMMDQSHDQAAQAMKLADEAIARWRL